MTKSTTESAKIQANAEKRYIVTQRDLPLSCPTPAMKLWNSHPRVYLPISETGRERCPYCSAEFVLEGYKEES
jgi:uncharacterized Zn-finger protein